MNFIISSKLYRASKYKDKILSAINDPINAELVQQLSDMVMLEAISDNADNTKPVLEDHSIEDVSNTFDDNAAVVDDSDIDKELETSEEFNSTEESIMGYTSSDISATSLNQCIDGDVSIDSLKGLLNADANTTGVNYGKIKNNEVWLYYDDSINLNDVMSAVIETLNAAAYTYLEFNRLARSDNAIVFEILQSPKDVQPIGSDEDE